MKYLFQFRQFKAGRFFILSVHTNNIEIKMTKNKYTYIIKKLENKTKAFCSLNQKVEAHI